MVRDLDIYIIVNFYPKEKEEDSKVPGEVFVTIAKQGSTLAGLMDAWATTLSVAFQHGVPWSSLREKYLHHRFEPADDKNPSIIHAIAVAIDEAING